MQLQQNKFKRVIFCALATLVLAAPAMANPSAEPTQEQVDDYEKVDDAQRLKLLMHLSRKGRQGLASTLLQRYPLQGPYAANRTLFVEGLILKADGDLTSAASKFRAALADDPSLTLVRSELAQTLVALQQDDSATHHLRLLAADAPTEQDAAGIRAFVDQIDARKPYKINAYIAAAPSTNVNNGSSHKTVYSPLFGSNLSISESGRKSSGIGGAAGVNASFNKRLGNDFTFIAAANGELRIYDESDFNAISLSQSAELRYMFDRGYLGLGGVASQSLDDATLDMGYLSYGPRLSARFNLTARDTFTASTVYEWRDYTAATAFDGTAWMTDVAWTHAFNSATNVTLSGGFDDIRVESEQNSYDSWSGGLALYKELPFGVTTSLSSEIKFSEFDAENLLAGKVREDTRYVAGIGVTKRDLNLFGFAPELSYTYVHNSSNITLYDYDSHGVDFRLTKEF